jgi:hypothetical protein
VNDRTCCIVESDVQCPGRAEKKKMCGKHYRRVQRYGSPYITKLIRGDDEARWVSKVDTSGGEDACHHWLGRTNAHGYGCYHLQGKERLAHVVAWERENGPVPEGKQVDHECHNQAVSLGSCVPGICEHRKCCNPRHMQLRTQQEHSSVTKFPDGHSRGSKNPGSKLTEKEVREIKSLLAAGMSLMFIGTSYGISKSTVSSIKRGKSWSYL